MKKLEDIPKKNLFEAPEGYFDKLPGVIQARVAESSRKTQWLPTFQTSLKFALPVLAIGIAALFYMNKEQDHSIESVIASIDSSELVAYLEESDLSSDELIESVPLDNEEVDAINDETAANIDLDEKEIEDLTTEFGADYF